MTTNKLSRCCCAIALILTLMAVDHLAAQEREELKGKTMQTVKGQFSVSMQPQQDDIAPVGRMTLEKHYEGSLSGTGIGQMLSHRTATEGSAGYVAIETITATLEGKSGSFVVQHSGIMNRGAPSLSITIVPDSGAGELQGIMGSMKIDIEQGQHFYTLDYSFAQ